jgi:hypothetical protein
MAKAIFMIPVMFHLTRGRKVQIEFVEIDKDGVTEEEIQNAIREFRRQGWEVKGVFIPKKISDA